MVPVTTPAQRRDERVKAATRPLIRASVAFTAVVVIGLTVVGWQEKRNHDLAHANRQALKAIAADQRLFDRFRVERAARTSATDRLICKAENSTREVERRRILRDFRNLDRNLRLLHIRKTPELVRVAKADRDRNLADLKPLPCKTLPTAPGANPP